MGRLESIAELVSVTLIRVVVFLAIGAMVTLGRFGFPRLSRVRFLGVLLLIGELIDFMRASVKSFAIRGEVRGTRKHKKTTAHINISKRVLRCRLSTILSMQEGRDMRRWPALVSSDFKYSSRWR